MEQKQTLWIIAAVGVFLLVVIGAALILYSPSWQTEPTVSAVSLPSLSSAAGYDYDTGDTDVKNSALDNSGWTTQTNLTAGGVSQTDSTAALSPSETGSVSSYNSGSGTTTIDLNSLKSQPAQSESAVASAGQYTVPRPSASAQPAAPRAAAPVRPAQSAAPSTASKAAPVAPAPIAPAASSSSVSRSSAAAPAKPAAAPAAPSRPADRFWVQVASLSSRVNAENARTALAADKIPCEVFTYDEGGKTMYRVRSGPYSTKSEAEFWQTRIATIDTFANTKTLVINSSAPAVK